jgi:DNA-binding NarL/FixJ family response regulator
MATSHKLFTVSELENIRVRLQSEVPGRVAEHFKRAHSAISRIAKSINDGTFDKKFVEPARSREDKAPSEPKSLKPKPMAGRGQEIIKLKAKGLSAAEVAKKFGTTTGNVAYWYYKDRNYKKTNGQPSVHKSDKRRAKILKLKEQGLTLVEIGRKVGVTSSTVGYYINSRKDSPKNQTVLEAKNGDSSATTNGNSTINKNIFIGIAYAEIERFIGLLSERLSISADILRPRLSELLGHPPLR